LYKLFLFFELLDEKIRDIVENDSSGKSIAEVEKENNLLRMHLRDINKKLSDFLEQHKVVLGQSKRYPEFKDKSEEQQIPTLIHEIENNEQILSLKTIEYKKLKERLDLIK
jgi:vacuolar-type H+-ATPase subunit I/STV1